MAKDAHKIVDYHWRVAYGEKLQDDIRRLQEENEYLKKLLWNSQNSWLEKQRAAQLVKEEATEMAVETQMEEGCGPPEAKSFQVMDKHQIALVELIQGRMESIGVLMTCSMHSYIEEELAKRFNLFKLCNYSSLSAFAQAHADSVRALVCNTEVGVDANTIDSFPKLEIVATYSVGFDNIDIKKCREKGIPVTNTPNVLTDCVADLAIALALALLCRISHIHRSLSYGLRKYSDFQFTTKLSGKAVGIVGLGRIGSGIAKRALGFGCPVSYHSRSEKPETGYKYYHNILDLAANSEILVVACALTEETRHIVNRQVIDALGPKGIVINIGRGPHIDEPELVSALIEGRLAGAGLDVFENEPDVPQQLLGLENVVLTPHVGSDTVETCMAMADLVIANLEACFLGKPLLTPVI
ncbi:hypothetical protein VNO77_29307 [Canavalia gladiata]|uniref:glyoxylate reductase (NADP(+)) n=1 Tax=Canavalia gladiata TaxID=3824 RepID=A0AAN9Q7R7_CANGL